MKPFSKQFTVWATSLKANVFERTRLKLTALYAVTMMIILVIFSGALYNNISKNIRVRLDVRPTTDAFGFIHEPRIPLEIQRAVKEEILSDIQHSIFLLDLILLFIITVVGYILAGKTLLPIQETFERQKRFIADASHDLRTPLSIMQSELEVALREKGTTHHAITEILASNLEEVHKMSGLVNDLLLMARLDDTAYSPLKTAVAFSELVQKVVKKFEGEAHGKKLTITTNLPPVTILGSEHLLERMLSNVIHNAITYTQEGTIAIIGSQEKNLYTLTIADTGVGIPKEEIPHIFDRFYRGNRSRTDTHHSGLGLAIAKEIAVLHKGTIVLTSTISKGTTVTLTFPIVEN
jgi:two-component system sensor histidine kinase CiaH